MKINFWEEIWWIPNQRNRPIAYRSFYFLVELHYQIVKTSYKNHKTYINSLVKQMKLIIIQQVDNSILKVFLELDSHPSKY